MGHTPPHLQVSRQRNNLVEVPHDVHTHMFKQYQLFNYLASAHDMWNEADRYTREDNDMKSEFYFLLLMFVTLDCLMFL